MKFELPNIRILICCLALAFFGASFGFVPQDTAMAQIESPKLVKTLTIEGEASAIEVVGDNVFVAHRSALGDPQIIRIYLASPERPQIEEHFNTPIDVRSQFVDLHPKNGRIYAANQDGLWMSNNNYEMDQIAVLEGAHAIADFGDNLIAAIGNQRLIFIDTARNNTQVGEFISPTPLTALAVGTEHRAFVADMFNGGSIRSFRLMRPDEGWGVMNEGGVSRLGKIDTIAKVGNRLWAVGPDAFYFLNLSPIPTMQEKNVNSFLRRLVRSSGFVVEIWDDWLHVIHVGQNGEVNNSYGDLLATLMSIQDPIVDAQTLGDNHLVVVHKRAVVEFYSFGEEQKPTATATAASQPTPTEILWTKVPKPIYLPISAKRYDLVVLNCTGGSDDPPACAIRTPEPFRCEETPGCSMIGGTCVCIAPPNPRTTPRIGTPPAMPTPCTPGLPGCNAPTPPR